MPRRKNEYDSIRSKMEAVGFQFEKEQKPHFQSRKENELRFIHPQLINRLEEDGHKVRARKFYIKPLTNKSNCEIGFVTGRSSPLFRESLFAEPNSVDSFDGTPSWTNRDSNTALDSLLTSIENYLRTSSDVAENQVNAYLLTWNPKIWDWTDLTKNIEQFETIGHLEKKWSCGNSTRIKEGDRVYLVRLGKEPKGIMGSGYATSSYYRAPHWDGTEDKEANYIDIEFDILIDPNDDVLFDESSLESIDLNNSQQWFPQRSGTSIKPDLIESLEASWRNFIKQNNYIVGGVASKGTVNKSELYSEGRSTNIIQTVYERNKKARKRCLEHYGYSCRVCNFNFEEIFGEVGKGFIHVHHIRQLSSIGLEHTVDPIKDLIPVCPNCHCMIHSKRPAFTIEAIKELRNTAYSKP